MLQSNKFNNLQFLVQQKGVRYIKLHTLDEINEIRNVFGTVSEEWIKYPMYAYIKDYVYSIDVKLLQDNTETGRTIPYKALVNYKKYPEFFL